MERDIIEIACVVLIKNFNSHAHVERDYPMQPFTKTHIISTHTLTWSVTSDFPRLAEWIDHFNSHAHVERDNIIKIVLTR